MKVLETRFTVSHVVIFALALGGCGHATVQPKTAERPGPDLQSVYGASTLTPSDLAFGRPQAGVSNGTGVKDVDLAAYLKPEALRARHSPIARTKAPTAAPTPAQKPALEAIVIAEPAQPEVVAKIETAKKTTDFDAASYAARERKSSGLEQYRGGDVIVITASTLVIILLVVLLVVLIT